MFYKLLSQIKTYHNLCLYLYFKKINAFHFDMLYGFLLYRGADKSLARPGSKQATATKL